MMTKKEIQVIENIIQRLEMENCGCGSIEISKLMKEAEQKGMDEHGRIEYVSRLYIKTWLIGPLSLMLPGEGRNIDRAVSMSSK